MNICHCDIDLDAFLCDIPSEWRSGIVKALCFVYQRDRTECLGVKKCETKTSLSPFTLDGTTLSVTYKDEHGVDNVKSLDVSSAIDNILAGLTSNCLMEQHDWEDLAPDEKLQAIFNMACSDCCTPTTTTTTSTTTSTTTVACYTYNVNNTSGSFNSFVYYDCSSDFVVQPLAIGNQMEVCALQGTVSAPGAIVTQLHTICQLTPPTTTTTSTTTTTTTSTSSTSTSTTSSTSSSSTSTSTTTSTTTLAPVACGDQAEFAGGQSFPQERTITLGSGTGTVTFHYNAFNIPDKFVVIYDGIEVINTGYVGSTGYQTALNIELTSRGEPLETITSPGANAVAFNKNTATTTAIVRVYAPLPDTQWNFTLDCPVAFPTTTSTSTTTTTTTSTSTTTTTSTTTAAPAGCRLITLQPEPVDSSAQIEWTSCSGVPLSTTVSSEITICTDGNDIDIVSGAVTYLEENIGDC